MSQIVYLYQQFCGDALSHDSSSIFNSKEEADKHFDYFSTIIKEYNQNVCHYITTHKIKDPKIIYIYREKQYESYCNEIYFNNIEDANVKLQQTINHNLKIIIDKFKNIDYKYATIFYNIKLYPDMFRKLLLHLSPDEAYEITCYDDGDSYMHNQKTYKSELTKDDITILYETLFISPNLDINEFRELIKHTEGDNKVVTLTQQNDNFIAKFLKNLYTTTVSISAISIKLDINTYENITNCLNISDYSVKFYDSHNSEVLLYKRYIRRNIDINKFIQKNGTDITLYTSEIYNELLQYHNAFSHLDN